MKLLLDEMYPSLIARELRLVIVLAAAITLVWAIRSWRSRSTAQQN